MEGRAAARHLRRREAARRRAFADRARWQRRGQVARAPRRAAVFLVRRGRSRRPRDLARRRSRPSARRPDAARSPATSRCARPAAAAARRAGSVWPFRNSWNRATENLFAAWIEKLFDDPVERGAVVAGAARGAARPVAQYPVQLSRSRRRRDEARHPPRLRRPAVFPARLFRVQDGAAVRLFDLLARRRRRRAEVLPVVQHPTQRATEVRIGGTTPPRRAPNQRATAAGSAAPRSASGWWRRSRSICRPWPTACIPDRAGRRRTTTTPTTIRWRSGRRRCGRGPPTTTRTGTF